VILLLLTPRAADNGGAGQREQKRKRETMENKYTKDSAIDVIRAAGASIKEGIIYIKSGSLGLHKIGAVDYLVKYHKYLVSWIR